MPDLDIIEKIDNAIKYLTGPNGGWIVATLLVILLGYLGKRGWGFVQDRIKLQDKQVADLTAALDKAQESLSSMQRDREALQRGNEDLAHRLQDVQQGLLRISEATTDAVSDLAGRQTNGFDQVRQSLTEIRVVLAEMSADTRRTNNAIAVL